MSFSTAALAAFTDALGGGGGGSVADAILSSSSASGGGGGGGGGGGVGVGESGNAAIVTSEMFVEGGEGEVSPSLPSSTPSLLPTTVPTSISAPPRTSSSSDITAPLPPGHAVRDLALFQTLLEQNARLGSAERAVASLAHSVADAASAAVEAARGVNALRAELAADARARAMEGTSVRVADYGGYGLSGLRGGSNNDPDGLRAIIGRLSGAEARAASTLSALAPADIDADMSSLHDLLPPSPGEVNALIDALSAHARRSLIAAGELRAAWAASRRGLLAIPTPVDVERRLLVRAGAMNAATEGEEKAGGVAWASATARGASEGDGEGVVGILTIGEGHVAAEFAAANSALKARVRALEMMIAARDALGGGAFK